MPLPSDGKQKTQTRCSNQQLCVPLCRQAASCGISRASFKWPCGLMDKALVFGTKDCRFESCQGHFLLNAPCAGMPVVCTHSTFHGESGVNGRMLLYESLVHRPATHAAVGEQVVCHTVPNEYLADGLSEVGPASIGALLAKRCLQNAGHPACRSLRFGCDGDRSLRSLRRATSPATLLPSCARYAKNDSCGVRTHALSDWRLKPAP